jgi:HlyD family secretion protein
MTKHALTSDNIELRSESVQEILGRPPRWIIRWGITIIFVVVAGLVIGNYFFKYPDVLTATITVTTENLPAGVVAKSSGRIDTIFVSEKQLVKKGDFIAVIENTACLEDVMTIKKYELQITNYDSSSYGLTVLRSYGLLRLGDLQPACQALIKANEDFQYFINADYHHKKIGSIKKQIHTQNLILSKSKTQLDLGSQQLETAYQLFTIDSIIFEKKAISNAAYQNAKNSYLQQLQSYESAKVGIDNLNISILQLEQAVFDLEQQRNEQLNNLQIAFTGALNQLQTQIKTWEQTYLIVSPIDGVVTLTKYWQKNQNINAGEVLVTVVPVEKTTLTGKILLPPRGAGKVKEGQPVNVKFDNYPYMEFGMVRVQIKNISLVPVTVENNEKAYMLEVEFPELLVTNYGKTLEFSQEMTGVAEIITEDLRLLDRFLNPIKAVIKR